ncbi:alpha/beta fold hydrolase [Devosia ginsengisoli]|uniref:Alpha/beta fold hydrolase n=1 Tax=Devosia ginsengisoli TaxID=400770 RepID=A0A5B8LTG0_9HYPH|nr:alpha/beta hydrolase [Devosia ginsengisoli]QDZ11503.1 alpha/beta fold hydrolase [Devosia ginsengisoli]
MPNFDDPSGAERRFAAVDGTRLAYRKFGRRDAPVVVLCHGLGANGRQFLADAACFAGHGYRVLVPDLRGHGLSDAPAGYPAEGFTIAAMAEDLVGLLDHAGADRVHWVGNSLGGILALHMLERHGGRFASFTTFGTSWSLDLPAISGPAVTVLYRLFGASLLARMAAAGTTRHRPARPLVADMLAGFDPKVGRVISDQVRRYDLTANALAFAGPMLVLVGGRDIAVNRRLRPTLARVVPRANLSVVELPEGGHMANLDAAEALRTALLAFWAVNPLPSASAAATAIPSPPVPPR